MNTILVLMSFKTLKYMTKELKKDGSASIQSLVHYAIYQTLKKS